MDRFKTILLVDDDPNDVELALAEHRLVNEIAVVNDGNKPWIFCTGGAALRGVMGRRRRSCS